MKNSSVISIIGAVATLAAIAGGVIAVDDRYTHQQDFTNFVMDYQADRIQNYVRNLNTQIWQLQSHRDEEVKQHKDTTDIDNQIKQLNEEKEQEQKKLDDYKKSKN